MPKVKIPIRVGAQTAPDRPPSPEEGGTESPETRINARDHVREPALESSEDGKRMYPVEGDAVHPSDQQWRERALRLQAEMDNFRKRQRRVAQDQARADQERLLSEMLGVVDNLDRTLAAAEASAEASPREADAPLHRGVSLTREHLLRLLRSYDVEPIRAHGEPFDPNWHEAVAVVPANDPHIEAGTVVEVTRSGYRRGERLFRPASVVVAQ